MSAILYREEKGSVDTEFSVEGVLVKLTRWDDEAYSYPETSAHYLLECVVVLDREVTVRTRKAYSVHGHTDPEMQRIAMREFDELVANHPSFGRAGGAA